LSRGDATERYFCILPQEQINFNIFLISLTLRRWPATFQRAAGSTRDLTKLSGISTRALNAQNNIRGCEMSLVLISREILM
jgi:hypothetical protein